MGINNGYIIIKESGIFTNGMPEYEKIKNIGASHAMFESLNSPCPIFKELHVIASETPGIYARYGIPTSKFGQNAWCRAVFCDETIGPWVWRHYYNSPSECAKKGLYDCLSEVTLLYTAFSKAVLDKRVTLMNALQINDLSLFDKKTLEINGYKITINKIKTK